MKDILELILVIVALASPFLIGLFLKHYFRYKSDVAGKLAKLDLKVAEANNEALHKLVVTLQSRVEVLEAIVTDEGYNLHRKIADL